jgi:hypothetical protein
VRGNVAVKFKSYQPGAVQNAYVLVNASSDVGKRLLSGKATSTWVRVMSDEEMGAFLRQMDELGFSANAQEGLSLENLRDWSERRGVITVEQDGRSRGIDFGTGGGPGAKATAYRDVKALIVYTHNQIPGAYEVKAQVGDPEGNLFQAPPARMPRR